MDGNSDTPEASQPRTLSDGTIATVATVIGALVAIPALLALLGTAAIRLGGSSTGTGIAAIFDFAYLLLGVGLMMRRELARQIYCVLAVISLVLDLGGVILGGGHHLAGYLAGLLLTGALLYFLTRPDVARAFHSA
ncbi:MAG TPA: hypothetical protein VNV44_14545 [Solirubrobacteraceae bacterium]|nr:hypothetical protein [Solirubrobacteraceae bacterium]